MGRRLGGDRVRRPRRSSVILVAIGVLAAVAAGASLATAATLELSVKPEQRSGASVVRVMAAGTADAAPASCPAAIGCELTVFVIRSGACPATPTSLIADQNIVVFLSKRGLPALIGTTPGPFSASGDYFLDGAPRASGQGNGAEGYTQSRWGTFIFCGYLENASATATFTNVQPDGLELSGRGSVRLPDLRIAVFSATCASPPCQITLSERAFAGGRRIPSLDSRSPSVETVAGNGPYQVSAPAGSLSPTLLRRTVTRYGSVALHFTGTVSDAAGGRVSAARTIVVRG